MSGHDLMPIHDGFPRPDWQRITAEIDDSSESSCQAGWIKWADLWLEATRDTLPDTYQIRRSENFDLLTAESERFAELMLCTLEDALSYIVENLAGIWVQVTFSGF